MPVQTTVRAVGRTAPRPPHAERRASARHFCRLEGSCRALPEGRGESWAATVRDISADGVGLLLRRRFEPGVLLAVELAVGREARSLLARVVHATAHAGGWLVGCRFLSPLDEDELRAILL
ncbi:MAG TPA: PilZ domain-containing protein [Gemmataceae bacterium]|nr:PilZ domain-containing protein [Gemmataceae bacterium]